MYPKALYAGFNKVIDKKTCDKIIKLGKKQILKQATIGSSDKNHLKKTRKSKVAFINDKWLYELLTPFLAQANQHSKWNYEYDWCENFQFTEYKNKGFYTWHADINPEPYVSEDPNYNGKVRKLSLCLTLNDGFEGGEFEVKNDDFSNLYERQDTYEVKEMQNRGSIVVFSSLTWHRVKPITKGTRYSLVCWTLGQPWR